jgi:hypothetical protein
MPDDAFALHRKAEACRQLVVMDQSAERKAKGREVNRRLGHLSFGHIVCVQSGSFAILAARPFFT